MEIKRGETLSFYIYFKDSLGQGVAKTNIFCQLRTKAGKLVDDLTITPTATTGKYLATAGDTSLFPVTTLDSDIQVRDGGIVVSSTTFEITILSEVTREV